MMKRAALKIAVVLLASAGSLAEAQAPKKIELPAQVVARMREDFEAIHGHPELGKNEIETAARVRTRLQEMGITTIESVKNLPTAVIAVVDSKRPGPTIAFRAEMDARKGKETTGLPYASKLPDLMHSCGHDAHAAILLGTAHLLTTQRSQWSGKVVLVFQPAEEIAGGADDIVADGILERLGVQALFALHSASGLPVGDIQLSPGPILAGSSYFTIKVTGRGSHAAAPFEGDDVVTGAAQLVSAFTQFPARHLDLLAHPAIVSVTTFQAGSEKSLNVLPTEATFAGTIRSFDNLDAAPSLRTQLTTFLDAEAKAKGLTASIDIRSGAPPTVNHEALYRAMSPSLAAWPTTVGSQPRGMFAEDFAYYTPKLPSLYFSLGIAKDKLGNEPVHTDRFSVHPDALSTGVRLFALLAFSAPQALKTWPKPAIPK